MPPTHIIEMCSPHPLHILTYAHSDLNKKKHIYGIVREEQAHPEETVPREKRIVLMIPCENS